tara:strand:+ start:13244 stop:14188 length:945 start_codon:yes stop_codon:yes gene_type:complete
MKTKAQVLFLLLSFFIGVTPAIAHQPTARIVKANGIRLFTQSIGKKGPAIIVLHGGPGLGHDYLLPQFEALADHAQVIFYDQRSAGRSTGEMTPKIMNLETFAKDLEAIRKAYDLDSFFLVGHSWGSLVAMQYATQYPDKLAGVVFVSSAALCSEETMSCYKELMSKGMAPYQKEIDSIQRSPEYAQRDPATLERFCRVWYRPCVYNPEHVNNITIFFTPDSIQKYLDSTDISQKHFWQNYNVTALLHNIACPVLAIHGDNDPWYVKTAETICDTIEQAELVTIENCGHLPFVEQPEAFFGALTDFIQKHHARL